MSHEHKQKGDKYQEDGHLSVLFNEVVKNANEIDPFHCPQFQWRVIFTTNSLGDDEIAGRCQKVSGAIRYLWGVDYMILIQKTHWDAATPLEKTRILVHEANHMALTENGEPGIRKHGGDFCAIAAHDKQSYRIASAIVGKLKNLKEFTTQEELAAVAV